MQTEEETAAAEEPILEEGSGREQVRKDILSVSSLLSVLHKSCACFAVKHPVRLPPVPKQPIISIPYTLTAALFCPNTCI